MKRCFSVTVTREKCRYTVEARGTGSFAGRGRALRIKRAVEQAFAALDPFAPSSPAIDDEYERPISHTDAAASLRLTIVPGDDSQRHYALRRRPEDTVFINSETPIEFAVLRAGLAAGATTESSERS